MHKGGIKIGKTSFQKNILIRLTVSRAILEDYSDAFMAIP